MKLRQVLHKGQARIIEALLKQASRMKKYKLVNEYGVHSSSTQINEFTIASWQTWIKYHKAQYKKWYCFTVWLVSCVSYAAPNFEEYSKYKNTRT